MTTPLQQRFAQLPAPHLADALELVAGSLRDYQALAEHHYRAQRPGTVMRVLALRDHRPTVVGRFLQQRDQTQTVGVLVESLSTLQCRLRDWALRERFGSWLPAGQRSRLLCAELRCISRVVIDPRWRGLGLAVRLVRHALDTATTPFTEALAAMGRVHPFFEKAGMTAYHRPPHPFDARLIAALERIGLQPRDLAALAQTWRTIEAQPPVTRDWLLKELHRWYRQNGGGRARQHSTDPHTHLHLAQQRLLLEPVYYLHDNR
ncbi:MAG: hypothetical protein ACODAQ_08315 [Phycisphaeraceae bacterium]